MARVISSSFLSAFGAPDSPAAHDGALFRLSVTPVARHSLR